MATEARVHKGDNGVGLYECDPYTWALDQAKALRERRRSALDWDNLAQEVEDLARGDERSLKGQCRVLIEHLLKLAYAPDDVRNDNLRLWMNSVRNARLEINDLLSASPGIRPKAPGLFTKAWVLGRNDALGKLALDDDAIPRECPWTLNQALENTFWPVRAATAGPGPR